MDKSGVNVEGESPRLDGEGMEPYQSQYRWVMLALVWLLYVVFGVVARSLAPLVTPIIEDLNITYSQMGIILGSWPLTYIAVAAIGGAIIDSWGIRKSLFLGIVIIGLSEVLRYFANGFTAMFLCVALFGLGGPMISIGCPKVISLWFSGKGRGTAVGVYMTGPWIGGLVAYSTANSIVMPLTGYSWRLTFVCYSLLALVVALLWWFLARDIKSTGATERNSIIEVFRGLISIRNVQLILIMGFLSFAIGHGFNDWLPKILETGGLPPAVAGFAASIPLLVAIPTVLTVPRLVTPGLRGRIVALSSLVVAIALLIIAKASGVPLIIGLVLYGLSFCYVLPLLMLILMDIPEVGSRYMGAAAGIFFCVAEVGGFAGPLVIGAIKDITGGFLIGAILIAGLSLARAVMALLIKIKPAADIQASS
ncbi:CynX/NimT family MFS transporter [Chloroflexota bacterium]